MAPKLVRLVLRESTAPELGMVAEWLDKTIDETLIYFVPS